ncbi:MAG: rhomboid family intramembrane serine protease [Candidatus Aenigmatarchaeota archaeon]
MKDRFKWWAIKLVLICIVVFILQNTVPSLTERFALISSRVLSEPYLLISSIFLHADTEHLIFNMFALGLFGSILEKIIGSKRLIKIFFVTGIIASVGSVFFYESALGASGAIFGLIGTLTILRPKMIVWAFGAPLPMFLAAFIWITIDIVGLFAPTGTANAAHLAGLFAGAAVGFYLRPEFKKEKKENKEKDLPSKKDLEDWEDKWFNK